MRRPIVPWGPLASRTAAGETSRQPFYSIPTIPRTGTERRRSAGQTPGRSGLTTTATPRRPGACGTTSPRPPAIGWAKPERRWKRPAYSRVCRIDPDRGRRRATHCFCTPAATLQKPWIVNIGVAVSRPCAGPACPGALLPWQRAYFFVRMAKKAARPVSVRARRQKG